MFDEVRSVPKFTHQKEKDKPDYKERRYNRKRKRKKKVEMYNGVKIPSKKTRGRITAAEYNEAARRNGEECFFCGSTYNLECHHVVPKGFSRYKNGRGVFRNLRFLCAEHHRGTTGVHQNRELMERLQEEHEQLYGPHFYKDAYDLYKENLIPNTTKEAYEHFFEQQEKSKQKPII